MACNEISGEFEYSPKPCDGAAGYTVKKYNMHCKLCFILQNAWQGKRYALPLHPLEFTMGRDYPKIILGLCKGKLL